MSQALPDIQRVKEEKNRLEACGVKYILSCWIDMFGVPKTKPVPISDFELLCMGKGPQFAVHSISFVPELGPADSDQIPQPDLDSIVVCPWDKPSGNKQIPAPIRINRFASSPRTCSYEGAILGKANNDRATRFSEM
jgi:glutamine synthetase